MHSAALIAARPAWSERLNERLHPGAHVILLTSDEYESIEARRAGFELRDTLLLLWPQMTSFAFLLRVPLPGTTTDQVDDTGTGMLNVAACRIGLTTETHSSGPHKPRNTMIKGMVGGTETIAHAHGRWPANACFIHGPACQRVGEARIDGHKGYPNGPGGSSSQFSQKGTATTRTSAWQGHADADGKETVAVWECQDNCPAKLLDAQSGVLKSGTFNQASRKAANAIYGKFDGYKDPKQYEASSGGASRFYPQFASPWELLDWLRALVGVPAGDLLEEV